MSDIDPELPAEAYVDDEAATEFDIINNDPKIRLARFGLEIDHHSRSDPVIKLILKKAFVDAVYALNQMVSTDPSNTAEVRRWRDIYLRCQSIGKYLHDTITGGHQLAQELEEELRDDAYDDREETTP